MEFLGAIIAKFSRRDSDVSIGEEHDLQTSQPITAAQSTETGRARNGAHEASVANTSTEGHNSSDHSTPTNTIGQDESVVPSAGHIFSGGVPFRARCRGRGSAAVPVIHSATAISDGSTTKADLKNDVVPPSMHRPYGGAAAPAARGGREGSFEAVGADSAAASNTGTAPDRDVTTEARHATYRPDVPVDPVTSAAPSTTTTRDGDAVQRFVTTVYTTLYSLPHGYDSIARLLRDLSEDSGLDGESVASELGYESFEAFLHSPEMAPRILVGASPDGRPRYKVYPTKADLERYVDQQLGTDYGDTKRALARQREENNRLRRHLASTMERVEKLKSEALAKHQPIPVLDSSRFKPSSTKTHTSADNTRGANADGGSGFAQRSFGTQFGGFGGGGGESGSDRNYCFNCGEEGHLARSCPTAKSTSGCHSCGEEGHFSKNCTAQRSFKCYNCGREGHMAKDCTEPRKADARQCYNCGEAGHIFRDCPNRPPRRPNDDPSYALPIRPIAEVFDEGIAVAQDYKKDKRQTLLFSATFPGRVQVFADEILRENHAVISRMDGKMVGPASRVKQRFVKALKWEKTDKMLVLLQEEVEEAQWKMFVGAKPELRRTLVFVRTNDSANVVAAYLTLYGINGMPIIGDLPQKEREEAMLWFRQGRARVIVATDDAELDIEGVDHVINLDLPEDYATYVHRVGRVHEGLATSFFDPKSGNDKNLASDLIEGCGLKSNGQEPPEFLNAAACGGMPVNATGTVDEDEDDDVEEDDSER